MSDTEILLILRPFGSFSTVNDFSIREGWQHADSFERTDTQFMEEIWEVDNDAAVVRYIDDHFVSAIYLCVTGDQRERVAQHIVKNLDIMPMEELWQDARFGKKKNLGQAVRFLSAIIDEYNPDFAKILDEAADHEDPEVRDAVLLSIGRAAWPELWPVVRRRYEKEKTPVVKSQAEALFESYSELVVVK